jgi:hypothetical protein
MGMNARRSSPFLFNPAATWPLQFPAHQPPHIAALAHRRHPASSPSKSLWHSTARPRETLPFSREWNRPGSRSWVPKWKRLVPGGRALRVSSACSSNFSLLAPDTLKREPQTGNFRVSRILPCALFGGEPIGRLALRVGFSDNRLGREEAGLCRFGLPARPPGGNFSHV